MPWISRRRYDRYYDPYYGRGWRRGPAYPQNSCLRDACLLETGCCIAEGLDGNCLMLTIPLLPRFFLAMGTGVRQPGRAREGSGPAARAVLAAIRVYQRDVSAHRPAV